MSTQIRKKDIVLLVVVLFILLVVMVVVFDVIPKKKKALEFNTKAKSIEENNQAIDSRNSISISKLAKAKREEKKLQSQLEDIDREIEAKVSEYKFFDISEIEIEMEKQFRKHGLKYPKESNFQITVDGPKVYKYTLNYKTPTSFLGVKIINPNEDPITSAKQKLYNSIMNNTVEEEDKILISGFDKDEDWDKTNPEEKKYSLKKPAMIMQKKGTPNEKVKAIINELNKKYKNIKIEGYIVDFNKSDKTDDGDNTFYISKDGVVENELTCEKIKGTVTLNISILMIKK